MLRAVGPLHHCTARLRCVAWEPVLPSMASPQPPGPFPTQPAFLLPHQCPISCPPGPKGPQGLQGLKVREPWSCWGTNRDLHFQHAVPEQRSLPRSGGTRNLGAALLPWEHRGMQTQRALGAKALWERSPVAPQVLPAASWGMRPRAEAPAPAVPLPGSSAAKPRGLNPADIPTARPCGCGMLSPTASPVGC